MSTPADRYTHGHHDSVLRSHRWRTAENSAAHLLPHLASGMRLLDVGCGPGTITVDLAARVAPGAVRGIDRSPEVIAEASAAAAGVGNVEFAVGDVYALDAPDGAFDVVHAHQVLHHLSDPVAALRELRRVCAPDGVVAVRETDYGAFTWWPEDDRLARWLEVYRAVARGNGAEPDAGRRLRSWALGAGFPSAHLESGASVWCFTTPEDRAWWGGNWAERVTTSDVADHAVDAGLASREELEEMAAGFRAWVDAPDAWFVVLHGYVVARP